MWKSQVDKRREEMQRVQQAAREKDRRARERRDKRDEKRREMQSKSKKAGRKRSNGESLCSVLDLISTYLYLDYSLLCVLCLAIKRGSARVCSALL